jgi:hypothetical protein
MHAGLPIVKNEAKVIMNLIIHKSQGRGWGAFGWPYLECGEGGGSRSYTSRSMDSILKE